MKKLILIVSILFSSALYAGENSNIPLKLINLDNDGRITFIQNARKLLGLYPSHSKYTQLQSIILSGDETMSDGEGALFLYKIELQNLLTNTEHTCEQILAVGTFSRRYTSPITCSDIN